jgi:hypothetical protein
MSRSAAELGNARKMWLNGEWRKSGAIEMEIKESLAYEIGGL